MARKLSAEAESCSRVPAPSCHAMSLAALARVKSGRGRQKARQTVRHADAHPDTDEGQILRRRRRRRVSPTPGLAGSLNTSTRRTRGKEVASTRLKPSS